MSTYQIKLLAISSMVIDHIGAFLFPQLFMFRIIGRISFFLFAWLLANGSIHTKSTTSYAKKLLFFAVISQVPYFLLNVFFKQNTWNLNILFTLFIGLILIELSKKLPNIFLKCSVLTVILILIYFSPVHLSYGVFGLISILFFYSFYSRPKFLVVSQVLTTFCFYSLPLLFMNEGLSRAFEIKPLSVVEPVGLLALFFILQYNGKEGKKTGYLFYLFYPVHLLVMYVLLTF